MRILNRIELIQKINKNKFDFYAQLYSLLFAIILIFFILFLSGLNIVDAVISFFYFSFGSWFLFNENLIIIGILGISSIGITLAKKCNFWNIGGEGQILLGALGGVLVALFWPETAYLFGNFTAIVLSLLFGGLIPLIIAILKVKRGADEVVLTLLSNFIIILLIAFLVSGPLQDQATKWIQSPTISSNFTLPKIFGFGRLGISIVIYCIILIFFFLIEKFTLLNSSLLVLGDNINSLRIIGYKTLPLFYITIFLSGALCGLSGWLEVSNYQYRLIENLVPSYGYYAILIAVLANSKILNTAFYTIICAIILNGIDGVSREFDLPIFMNYIVFGATFIFYSIIFKLKGKKIIIKK